jgi:hypothetical protein
MAEADLGDAPAVAIRRAILAGIHIRLTEGFDAAEFKDAKARPETQ